MAARLTSVEIRSTQGDRFRGVYASMPTRQIITAEIAGSRLNEEVAQRLVDIVEGVRLWPRAIAVRRVELSFKERRRIGLVIFDMERMDRGFNGHTNV